MPTYDTKYGRITLTPACYSRENPSTPAPDPPVDPSALFFGAESMLYIYAQNIYPRLGRRGQLYLAECIKRMRPAIIAQTDSMPDSGLKRLMRNNMSPALHPDAPNAPPDVPASASYINAILQVIAARDGLDMDAVAGEGNVPIDRLAVAYGFEPPERIVDIRRAAFGDGILFANSVHANMQSVQRGGAAYNGVLDGHATAQLQQAAAKRPLHPDGHGDGPAQKRARAASADDAESDTSDNSDDSSAGAPSGDLDLDLDMDTFSNPDDAGAGTGMAPAPQVASATTATTTTTGRATNKADNWEQLWHSLPYESRLHKLGPGMSRQNLLPASEFALPLQPTPADASGANTHASASINDQVAVYKGKGVPPRYATFAEAMARAPDDYDDYPEAFAWEVAHGRAAPAVLPQDQRLRVVPFLPAMPLPTKAAYDPQVPAGTAYADDTWTNHVTVLDPGTGEVRDVMVMPGVPHNTPQRPHMPAATAAPAAPVAPVPAIPIHFGRSTASRDGNTAQGSSTDGARGAQTGGHAGGANRPKGQSRGFLRFPRWGWKWPILV